MSRPGKDFVPVNLSKDAEKISLASSASKSVNRRPSGLLFFSPVLSGASATAPIQRCRWISVFLSDPVRRIRFVRCLQRKLFHRHSQSWRLSWAQSKPRVEHVIFTSPKRALIPVYLLRGVELFFLRITRTATAKAVASFFD